MDSNSQYELYLLKKELQSVIDELYSISAGIQRDFVGIGNDVCARNVMEVARAYESVKNKLERIDTSALTEEYIAKVQAQKAAAGAAVTQTTSSKTTSSKTTSSKTTSTKKKKGASAKSFLEEIFDWI